METSEEYAESGGTACPACGSSNINSEGIQSDDGVAWADCDCDDCKSTWTDQYSITGYANLVEGGE